MDDLDVVRPIGGLADEQYRQERSRAGEGFPRASWRARTPGVALDRCWDVLRQCRARCAAGGDLGAVAVRSEAMEEGYQP